MPELTKVQQALDALEAERIIETVKLRNELIRAARELLPQAIELAKPKKAGDGFPARPGNPSLLRLISRLAMRDVAIERRKR